MNKLPLAILLVAALALAGCASTDENADPSGNAKTDGNGRAVEGTMEVTGEGNETNTTGSENSTNTTASS